MAILIQVIIMGGSSSIGFVELWGRGPNIVYKTNSILSYEIVDAEANTSVAVDPITE